MEIPEQQEDAAPVHLDRGREVERPEELPLHDLALCIVPHGSARRAQYILQNKPDAKIAVLSQNDDFGRDYVKGFKEALGTKAASMIIKEATYDLSDPTIDSQLIALKNSGADTFFDVTTPKFGAQAVRKVAEIGWKPLHYIVSVASSIKSVLIPAGADNAVGLITAVVAKTPGDPQWKDSSDVRDYLAFMKTWNGGSDPDDQSAVTAIFPPG